ncbi:MAG: T9SS type A sorting domain-containing protein [Bacteroidetes bacterium]|nr:T9SS type A sorting domain-containing protein [Bacteroidota bacterium]
MEFGNGATSTSASPSYTYPLPGIYKVTLKMSTQFGNTTCHDSLTYYIVANTSNPCKDSGFVNNYNYSCGTYISPVCGCDSITYSSYCAAYKAGVKQTSNGPCPKDTNYVKICGYVYNDVNKNCAKDSNENGLNSIQIILSGSQTNLVTYTNTAGYYFFFAPKGSYTVKQNLSQSTYNWNTLAARQLCPGNNASINVSAPTGGSTYCNNHFYDTIKSCKDLGVHITKYRNITPGFPRTLYLNYKNYSPFAVSNVKVYYKKNTVQTFVSATPAASGSSGNTYFWNLGTLAANQSGMIKVELFTPVGTPLGTVAKDSVWILPDSGDCELANNKANLTDYCKGSWDPNDKAVSPAGEGDNGAITRDVRTLDYLVRFQNTGTAPAFNVKVEDQLDGDFDWTSLKINAVSHPYTVSLEDGGKLVFEFQDIMLPDSGTDEAASHGFINYSIDMKENLNYGTEMTNTAAIFFDFNEPVITNTTVNTLVQKTSGIISVQSNNVKVNMYPNPIQAMANFVIQSEKAEEMTIEIFDITGKSVKSIQTSIKEGNQTLTIPMQDVLSGLYIVNIMSEGNKVNSFKMIKE